MRRRHMLDAYIIDRIREEREQRRREGALVPLHKEVPRPPRGADDDTDRDDTPAERGSVVIDFQL